MNPLHPAIRTVWTIRYAAWATAVLLAAGFYDLAGLLAGADRLITTGTLTALALLIGIPAALVAPRLRYRFWQYELREDELYLERGVFNRVRTVVPLRRIQHLDVSQNVLEREFNLGKLIVHTAGTRASTVELPGLQIEAARRMYDDIKGLLLEEAL